MLTRGKKSKFVVIFWVLFYFLVFLLLVQGGFSYLDPDFGWHLRVGQEISLSGQVPSANTYNYTYTGNWVDHEWLSNLALYHIYSIFGYESLVIVFALLVVMTLVALNIFVFKKNHYRISLWLSAALQLLGVLAAMPHFGVRLQELALPFVLAVVVILYYYERRADWRLLLFLPPLFFLWANLHASFLIGLFLMAAFIAIKIGERILKRFKFWSFIDYSQLLTPRALWLLVVGFGANWIATLLTPYKLGLYNFLAGYQNKAYLSLIQEWLPQYALPFHYDQLIYLAIGTAAALFYIYFRLRERQGLAAWPLFLMFVFLILSFQSRRHFPLFIIITFGFIMETYSQLFSEIKIAYSKWLRYLVIFCLILVSFSKILEIRPINDPFSGFCADYPCAAIEFLRTNPQYTAGHVFNEYGWGGFLIARLPEVPLFIDGRLPQVAFADWTFIEEYNSFFRSETGLQTKLDKYDIQTILIKAQDKPATVRKWERILFIIRNQDLIIDNKLRAYLEQSTAWTLVYQDEAAKVYVRKELSR